MQGYAPQLKEKMLQHLDGLIAEGTGLLETSQAIPGRVIAATVSMRTGESTEYRGADRHIVKANQFIVWRTSVITLLHTILPSGNPHRESLPQMQLLHNDKGQVQTVVSILQSIRRDFEAGLFDDLGIQVEAEMSADYMGQADQLLAEGASGQFNYVPAAVLAGAVLEKRLRTMCTNQTPPIPAVKEDGSPKMLNSLIDDLKKAGLYKEAQAKELRGWAAIRNDAAHGNFEAFRRDQVERMISGINGFLGSNPK